jgi:hypothetical protein
MRSGVQYFDSAWSTVAPVPPACAAALVRPGAFLEVLRASSAEADAGVSPTATASASAAPSHFE